ncbi:oogenesis-related protein sosie [Cotesia typhae]|uniref:oogenesis-related protein sosie n=1 Tax=Cotesia typhae TaxID=2053667 RepID=UPI003D681E49
MKKYLLYINLLSFIIFLILLPINSSALTTFGKTNTQNQNPPPPTPAYNNEVVIGSNFNKSAFELARLTSMGRSGMRPTGLKGSSSHVGHNSLGKARECKAESDCSAIQNTTCVQDPNGDKKRCLCGDLSAPVNGFCSYQFKALHAICNDDNECGEGAECSRENATSSTKKCVCKEDYYEEDFKCNGSISLENSLLLLIFSILTIIKY